MTRKSRRGYDTDLTDEQWAIIEPLLCDDRDPSEGGRPLKHDLREIVNAMLYINRTGCAWRLLPSDLPPWQTVYWWFKRWNDDGTRNAIHAALVDRVRVNEDCNVQPSAAIIDSQSVRGADTVGKGRRGYDAGKQVNGTKRHIAVDVNGMLLALVVTAASVQDRRGGKVLMWFLDNRRFNIALVWADGGYAGKLVDWTKRFLGWTLEIVKRPDDQQGFEVLPRRWVVERTFSWLMRNRRLVRDYERTTAHAIAWNEWAMIGLMVRRLAPARHQRAWTSKRAA